jgi:DNA-binding IclR family transcriptional regulator
LRRRMERSDDNSGSQGGVQVIARAANILRVLEDRPEGLTLTEIAHKVDLARSTVQRIITALAAEDFVIEAQPGRGTRIGPGLARIAASLASNHTELLHTRLVGLSEKVGETVDLSILSGGSAVFIDQIPGRQRLVALSAIGQRFPLHCTANGKAMLACYPQKQVPHLVDKSVAVHADHPPAARIKLLNEIETARRRHLAFDLGEHDPGIGAIGIAVFDSFGRPIAVDTGALVALCKTPRVFGESASGIPPRYGCGGRWQGQSQRRVARACLRERPEIAAAKLIAPQAS